ncbi:MAG: hypothetical protein GF398_07775 [Chitinivibrionales bacterium]|nr:hypothetical protein [Chitinivibrionales bacterium]
MQTSRVESYCGYKADEYPRAFTYDSTRLEVIEIEDRWYEPDINYFKVFADDGGHYILARDLISSTWQVGKK